MQYASLTSMPGLMAAQPCMPTAPHIAVTQPQPNPIFVLLYLHPAVPPAQAVARKALVELLRMQHQVDVALGGAGDTATTSPSAPGTGGSASWASSVSWTGWDRNVTGSWGSAGTQQAPKSRWRKLWG